MGRLKNICFLLIILLFTNVTACSISNEPISKSSFFMGTIVNITLYDKKNQSILEKVFKEINTLEEKFSLNIPSSEVNEINKNAGNSPVKVSNETFEIINKAIEISKMSKGSFDITIGPLVNLWGIGSDKARLPSKSEIDYCLDLIGYENIILDESTKSVFLKKEKMILDLGAIAKGYIADIIKDMLINEGVKKAIIDLGGNIFALGEKSKNTPWTIGIQNPFENRGTPLGTLKITNQSVVTSGIYERFLEVEGIKYHHILNPSTGYPFHNELASVSIISSKSIDGDALSTATFALGIEDGLNLINSLNNIEAIFVNKNREIYLSNGLTNNFELLNKDFTIIR